MAPLLPRMHVFEIDDQSWYDTVPPPLFPSPSPRGQRASEGRGRAPFPPLPPRKKPLANTHTLSLFLLPPRRFPPFLRAHVQNALSIVWTTALPLSSSPATLAARILQHHLPAYASHTYIDFCAGGGGPTPEIERVLNAGLRRRRVGDATFVMTDLHPNVESWRRCCAGRPSLAFEPRSVDARDGGDVVRKWVDKGRAEGRWPVGAPGARDGARVCRLFNLAFHHFDDALAGDIVKDTVETSHAFAYVALPFSSPPFFPLSLVSLLTAQGPSRLQNL